MTETPSLICVRRSSCVVGKKLRAPNWPITLETPGREEFDVRGRISWLIEKRRSLAILGLRIEVHCATPVWMRSFSVPLLLRALVVSVSAPPPTDAEFAAAASLKL